CSISINACGLKPSASRSIPTSTRPSPRKPVANIPPAPSPARPSPAISSSTASSAPPRFLFPPEPKRRGRPQPAQDLEPEKIHAHLRLRVRRLPAQVRDFPEHER